MAKTDPSLRIALLICLIAVPALAGLGYARDTLHWPAISSWLDSSHAAERHALWAQAGLWLRDHAPPEATVWSDEEELLGTFKGRIVKLQVTPGSAAMPETLPDYCVTSNTLAWAERVAQPWFQEHYGRVTFISNPYDSIAPLEIWRYWPSPFDVGPTRDVGARFGEAAGRPSPRLELVSYRLDSTYLIPGEASYLTLAWRALDPVTRPLAVRVRVYAPDTGRVWAQVDQPEPGGVRTSLWPPGQLLTDRYTLDMPEDLPAGIYALEVRVGTDEVEVEHFLPVYESGDASRTDGGEQLTLAHLEAQPWVSQAPLQAVYPLTATFGGEIELIGYDLRPAPHAPLRGSGTLRAGQTEGAVVSVEHSLRVRLYWHALATPGAAYKVFVHVLTADNRLVAQHDGVPVYETYPTDAWQAGQTILDEHRVLIDPSVPPGRYDLKVGLYLPESGERLEVRDPAGQDMPDRSLPLIQVDVE